MLMFNRFGTFQNHIYNSAMIYGVCVCVSLAVGPNATGPPATPDSGPDSTSQPRFETIIYKMKKDVERMSHVVLLHPQKALQLCFDSNSY